MTNKELVKICEKTNTCSTCKHDKVCDAYQAQFKCYPFEERKRMEYAPELYNDTQIQFPDFII